MSNILTRINAAKSEYQKGTLGCFNPEPTHIMLGPTDYAEACQAISIFHRTFVGSLSEIMGMKVILVPIELVVAGTLTLVDSIESTENK